LKKLIAQLKFHWNFKVNLRLLLFSFQRPIQAFLAWEV